MVVRSLGLYFIALGAALVFSTFRLRDLALGDAPLPLWLPFARPLLSAAFEISLLLGAPAAWLVAYLRARQVHPSLPSAAPTLAGMTVLLVGTSVGGALLSDVGTRPPGQLAQQLIETSRQTCETAPGRSVPVPLVKVAWACPPGGPTLVSGKAAELGGGSFTATSLRVSDDLRRFELADLKLELAPKGERIGARIAAGRAKIKGMPPWGRPRNVSLVTRLAASLLGASAAVGACVLAGRITRWPSLLPAFGGIAGLVLLAAQQWLDRSGAGSGAYFAVVPAGAAAVGFCAMLVRRASPPRAG